TRKLNAMELKMDKGKETVRGICACNIHTTENCPTIPAFRGVLNEQANAVNNYQRPFTGPNSNTYNPGWKNHPNFSWRNGQTATP
ncbi:hypothetical protein PJP07_29735, partial [Mycobacterium kansasii]